MKLKKILVLIGILLTTVLVLLGIKWQAIQIGYHRSKRIAAHKETFSENSNDDSHEKFLEHQNELVRLGYFEHTVIPLGVPLSSEDSADLFSELMVPLEEGYVIIGENPSNVEIWGTTGTVKTAKKIVDDYVKNPKK